MLTLCTLLYVTTTTGIGMVTSTFTSSQVAAVFITAILTIHADRPVLRFVAAGLDAGGQRPVHWFDLADNLLHALQRGCIHQGARPDLMIQDIIFLACCIPILWAVSMVGLKKQEK